MTQTEVQRLLSAMDGKQTLMARLIYGSGLWLMENGMAAVNRLVEQGVGCNKVLVRTRGCNPLFCLVAKNNRQKMLSLNNND